MLIIIRISVDNLITNILGHMTNKVGQSPIYCVLDNMYVIPIV